MKSEQSDVNVVPVRFDDIQKNSVSIDESSQDKSLSFDMKRSKWTIVKAANRRVLPRASQGETKLSNIIDELKKFTIEHQQEIEKNEQGHESNLLNSIRLYQRRLRQILQKPAFHYTIILLVMTDLIIVLVDLILAQLSSPCLTNEEMQQYNTTEQRDTCLLEHSVHLVRAELFLFYFSAILLAVFVIEVFISFFTFGWKFYKNPLYLLDSTVVLTSFIMELYFHYGNIGRAGRAAAAIVILRLWKIVRAIHAVAHSITIKNRLLIKKIEEAKVLLEEEKQEIQQILEKQEIKVEYFMQLLKNIGKLPSKSQIDKFIDNEWKKRQENAVNNSNN